MHRRCAERHRKQTTAVFAQVGTRANPKTRMDAAVWSGRVTASSFWPTDHRSTIGSGQEFSFLQRNGCRIQRQRAPSRPKFRPVKQQVWVIGSRETASASPLARRFSGAINLGGVVGAVTANVYAPAIGLETNLGFLSVGGGVLYAPAIGTETTWVSFPSAGVYFTPPT